MSIIQRYITREFFKYFAIVQVIVLCLFISIDYLTRIGAFMNAGLSLAYGFGFVLLKTPYMVVMLTPVCSILSFIVVFGLMGKNNEILALSAGGVSRGYLLKPVFIIGLLLSVSLFFISETIVPDTMSKANSIKITEIKKKKIKTTRDNNIWFRKNQMIIHIKYYNPTDQSISGITLYSFGKDGYKLERRVDAQKGVFADGSWVLQDVVEQTLDQGSCLYDTISHEEKREAFNLVPEDFKSIVKNSDEMGYEELKEYITRIEGEGYDANHYRVDLQAKVAFPFVCLVMSIIGSGIALRRKRSEGLPTSIAMGLGVAFIFWVLYGICLSLGYGEMLPPLVAAWTANVIFICIGFLIILSID